MLTLDASNQGMECFRVLGKTHLQVVAAVLISITIPTTFTLYEACIDLFDRLHAMDGKPVVVFVHFTDIATQGSLQIGSKRI